MGNVNVRKDAVEASEISNHWLFTCLCCEAPKGQRMRTRTLVHGTAWGYPLCLMHVCWSSVSLSCRLLLSVTAVNSSQTGGEQVEKDNMVLGEGRRRGRRGSGNKRMGYRVRDKPASH